MALSPDRIASFYSANLRRKNDISSKAREAIFHFIANGLIKSKPNRHLTHRKFGSQWRKLQGAMQDLFSTILPKGSKAIDLIRFGGRSHNYDFKLIYVNRGETAWIPLELKRGRSIYDQPEFLSLYTTDEIVRGITYPEFFFDEYIRKFRAFKRFNPPKREDYLRFVFRSEYSCHPFFMRLYRSDNSKTPREIRATTERANLVNLSKDRYLREHALKNLRTDVIQKRLRDQIPKHFLSWAAVAGKFHVERFTKLDVSIVGKPALKAGREGLINTLIFRTRSGNEIHALLRWKNHIGVLGPAWQIKMIQAPTSDL